MDYLALPSECHSQDKIKLVWSERLSAVKRLSHAYSAINIDNGMLIIMPNFLSKPLQQEVNIFMDIVDTFF